MIRTLATAACAIVAVAACATGPRPSPSADPDPDTAPVRLSDISLTNVTAAEAATVLQTVLADDWFQEQSAGRRVIPVEIVRPGDGKAGFQVWFVDYTARRALLVTLTELGAVTARSTAELTAPNFSPAEETAATQIAATDPRVRALAGDAELVVNSVTGGSGRQCERSRCISLFFTPPDGDFRGLVVRRLTSSKGASSRSRRAGSDPVLASCRCRVVPHGVTSRPGDSVARMALVEFLWYVVSAPGRLMPILWPVLLGIPLFVAALTSGIRVLVLRRVDRARLHPAMQAGPRWAVIVAVGTFLATWTFVAAAVAVTLLVAGVSG